MDETFDICIYCKAPVDTSRSEGDHVNPDAFGEFEGQFFFKRICPACNSRIGKCEEQLLRCAPESFFRRIVQPKVTRDNRGQGRKWVGADGIPPPAFSIDRGDHRELVEPLPGDPRSTRAVDQLVVTDKEKGQQYIRLFPGMTASRLHERVAEVAPERIGECIFTATKAGSTYTLLFSKRRSPI